MKVLKVTIQFKLHGKYQKICYIHICMTLNKNIYDRSIMRERTLLNASVVIYMIPSVQLQYNMFI